MLNKKCIKLILDTINSYTKHENFITQNYRNSIEPTVIWHKIIIVFPFMNYVLSEIDVNTFQDSIFCLAEKKNHQEPKAL